MKKLLPAGLAVCVLLAGAALFARQQASRPPAPAGQIERHVEAYLRNYYAWNSDFQVKVDPPKASPIPDIYEVSVLISYKGQSDRASVYVSHDGRYLIRGALSNLFVDPFAADREKLLGQIDTRPYTGAAKACVNVVEFSDYECPHCRDAHQFMNQLANAFPQVRFTFMDFPLSQIHPWALDAALVARCAFEEHPEDFGQLRDKFFDNQDKITPPDDLDTLLDLASQAGLDPKALRACIALPSTRKLIDDDLALGKEMEVASTPTIFVNGRPVVGGSGPVLDQLISYELAKCQPKPAAK